MFGWGFQELLVILVILILIFGARRLPEIGSGLGKAIKSFKAGVSSDEIDVTPKKENLSEGETSSPKTAQEEKSKEAAARGS